MPSTRKGFPSLTLGDGGVPPLLWRHRGMVPEQPKVLYIIVTIATLTQKDGGTFEGQHTTFSITAQIALVKNGRKVKDNKPDFRIVSRKNDFEFGGDRYRTSRSTGEEYISVSLSAPEFGTIYGNLAQAPADDKSKEVIIWNPPSRPITQRPRPARPAAWR